MPIAPPRNCDYPGGCLGYAVFGSQYCKKHQPKAVEWRREQNRSRYKNNPHRHLYDKAGWYNGCAPACLIRDPLCKLQITPLCKQHGGDPAVIVDHIRDHKGDPKLFFDMANLQGVCKACHDMKTGLTQGGQKLQPIAPTGSDSGAPQFITAANDGAVDRALADDSLGDVDLIKIPR